MKIHLLSDIHTEFYNTEPLKKFLSTLPIEDAANTTLILAGDIAVGRSNLKRVLAFFAERYKHVIYVPGNHEYYSAAAYGDYRKMENLPNNVHVLDCATLLLEGIVFIGATLWSDLNSGDVFAEEAARRSIPDFRRMPDNTPTQFIQRHTLERDYIFHMHDEYREQKKVIITHFLPSERCISQRWKTAYPLNYYFAAHDMELKLEYLENTPYWFFGHTHDEINVTIGETNFVASPYGYPGETGRAYIPAIFEV